jgi:hypothetical protein
MSPQTVDFLNLSSRQRPEEILNRMVDPNSQQVTNTKPPSHRGSVDVYADHRFSALDQQTFFNVHQLLLLP